VQGWLYQDQLNPVAELDSLGNVVSQFVYGTRANVPDYLIRNDTTYRIVSDHLGSVRLVVNISDGAVVQRVAYDEFGRELENTNPGFQPFGYAGGFTDANTGLVLFGSRDFVPSIGRWATKDPIGLAAGPNLYVYVMNDPVNLVDPLGLDWLHTLSDLSAGFGDMISFGLTARFRQLFSYDDVVNRCGGAYGIGQLAATATSLLSGGHGLLRGALRMGGRRGGLGSRFVRGLRRFFSDDRTFGAVSREYWRGGAGGMQLHHWFQPQRGGAINAGWNLLEVPAALNSLMNGSSLVGNATEWAIRLGIPGSLLGGAALGASYGLETQQACQCQ
jgi:RHS repeat-associated protein